MKTTKIFVLLVIIHKERREHKEEGLSNEAGIARDPTAFCVAFRFAKEPRPTPLGNIVGRASRAKREGAYIRRRRLVDPVKKYLRRMK